ncbi:MAG: signal peptidase II [Anaerolineales bacterium]
MKSSSGRVLLWGGALAVLIADQLSKLWVIRNLELYVPTDIFPWLSSILSFTRLTNTGVAFGLLPQFGDFFTLLSAVVILVIIFFYRTLEVDDSLTHLALGLQIGGALGNLVDRLFRGFVVDFIDVNFWPLEHWPVFNIADAAIVVGVGLLLVSTWLQERDQSALKVESEEVTADA